MCQKILPGEEIPFPMIGDKSMKFGQKFDVVDPITGCTRHVALVLDDMLNIRYSQHQDDKVPFSVSEMLKVIESINQDDGKEIGKDQAEKYFQLLYKSVFLECAKTESNGETRVEKQTSKH